MLSTDRLRLIDRILGVPACALATAWLRCRRPAPAPPPRSVVFIQLAESGSNVLADPAVRRWAARAEIPPGFVTFAHNRASLRLTGTIADADVFTLDPASLATLLRDVLRLRRWLRARRADTLVDLELFTRASALIGALCGTPRRVGFDAPRGTGLYRGRLYTDPVRFEPDAHIALNYLALVEPLTGQPPGALVPGIARRAIAPAEATRVGATLDALFAGTTGPLVLVNPNAGDLLPQRRWPPARFRAFIERWLARAPHSRVLLIGGAGDADTNARLHASIDHPRCADGTGRFPLGDLPALFARAAMLVTNDSGPAHFAAVGTLPVIALFGPETPRRFGPLGRATVLYAGLPCSPCVTPANQRRSACRDNRCMQSIAVDAVLDAAADILHGRDGAGRSAAA